MVKLSLLVEMTKVECENEKSNHHCMGESAEGKLEELKEYWESIEKWVNAIVESRKER
jgi:hypothetical protein